MNRPRVRCTASPRVNSAGISEHTQTRQSSISVCGVVFLTYLVCASCLGVIGLVTILRTHHSIGDHILQRRLAELKDVPSSRAPIEARFLRFTRAGVSVKALCSLHPHHLVYNHLWFEQRTVEFCCTSLPLTTCFTTVSGIFNCTVCTCCNG